MPLPEWTATDLVAALPQGPIALLDGLSWEGRPCTLVAWDPVARVTEQLDAALRLPDGQPLPTGIPPLSGAAVGHIAWDGAAHFWLPGAAALFDPQAGQLWLRGNLPSGVGQQGGEGAGTGGGRTTARQLWDWSGFNAAVRAAQVRMEKGTLAKVILSVPWSAPCNGTPLAVYQRLTATSPPGLRYILQGEETDGALIGVSPEPFVMLTGHKIDVHLLAGTRKAAGDAERELLTSNKDRREHTIAVVQARRDLESVCMDGSVSLEAFLTLERHPGLVHLASHLSGLLRDEVTSADLIRACFPTATVGGIPREAAVTFINGAEPSPRNWYAGVVGALLPGGDLQLWLTIRSLLLKEGTAFVRTGAGIVRESNPAAEWRECMNKARHTLAALGAEVGVDGPGIHLS